MTDNEIGQKTFELFRPRDPGIWKHVGDKESWIRLGRSLIEFGMQEGWQIRDSGHDLNGEEL